MASLIDTSGIDDDQPPQGPTATTAGIRANFTAILNGLNQAATEITALQSTVSGISTASLQPLDAQLTAIAALSPAADTIPYFSGAATAATASLTSTGRTVIAATSTASIRSTLGVVPGTDVQAYSAKLAALAGLTYAADQVAYYTGTQTASTATLSSFGRSLIDDTDAATSRATLGLGTMAVQAASSVTITGGTAAGMTSVATTDLLVASQTLTFFRFRVTNNGGTIQHKITAMTGSSLGNYVSKITSASATDTTTPTATDSSTAFATGCKIASTDSSILVFDTADQTVATIIGLVVIDGNSTGTALMAQPIAQSRNVNGTTRTRLEVQIKNAATNAGFNLNTTNITAGNFIDFFFLGFLA